MLVGDVGESCFYKTVFVSLTLFVNLAITKIIETLIVKDLATQSWAVLVCYFVLAFLSFFFLIFLGTLAEAESSAAYPNSSPCQPMGGGGRRRSLGFFALLIHWLAISCFIEVPEGQLESSLNYTVQLSLLMCSQYRWDLTANYLFFQCKFTHCFTCQRKSSRGQTHILETITYIKLHCQHHLEEFSLVFKLLDLLSSQVCCDHKMFLFTWKTQGLSKMTKCGKIVLILF